MIFIASENSLLPFFFAVKNNEWESLNERESKYRDWRKCGLIFFFPGRCVDSTMVGEWGGAVGSFDGSSIPESNYDVITLY